jgi:hypothetical protein
MISEIIVGLLTSFRASTNFFALSSSLDENKTDKPFLPVNVLAFGS